MTDKAIYVCGPMTGIPKFNYPLFEAVTAQLRADGLLVISPAEQDSAHMQELAKASPDGDLAWLTKQSGESWGDVLSRDVKLIHDHIKGFALLPGWTKSRGAKLEVFVGLLCGITDFAEVEVDHDGFNINEVSPDYIREQIRGNMP